MNLLRAIGTIGGLTMVSRVFGFAREMLMARIMGASGAADAFLVAFRLPNTFRRLFGEGAFSAGFVPLFSAFYHGEGGIADAKRFSEEVLAVFLPGLFAFTIVFEIAMPLFVAAIASGYEGAKFALTVELTRITFPYLLLISLVSLFSGVLNSLTRFAAAAFAPALLNVTMIAALLIVPEGGIATAYALAWGVTAGGLVQLALVWNSARRAGISLRLRRPRITPDVRRFFVVVIPATVGAGVYQISQLIDTFFATRLPEGSMSYLNYSDRLNQLPLSVIGTALGTAILPQISRFIAKGEPDAAARVQSQAVELAMLLCLPAFLALVVVAEPLVAALFQGGRFTAYDAMVTGRTLAIIVAGLPAYVLVKVITPGFYARQDTATPVKTAAIVLVANVILNFVLIPPFGIYGLAAAIAICSWLNAIMLYVILHRRGHFRIAGALWGRILRQLAAGGLMVAALVLVRQALDGFFAGSVGERLIAVVAVCGVGAIAYFGAAFLLGGMDRQALATLLRRRRKT